MEIRLDEKKINKNELPVYPKFDLAGTIIGDATFIMGFAAFVPANLLLAYTTYTLAVEFYKENTMKSFSQWKGRDDFLWSMASFTASYFLYDGIRNNWSKFGYGGQSSADWLRKKMYAMKDLSQDIRNQFNQHWTHYAPLKNSENNLEDSLYFIDLANHYLRLARLYINTVNFKINDIIQALCIEITTPGIVKKHAEEMYEILEKCKHGIEEIQALCEFALHILGKYKTADKINAERKSTAEKAVQAELDKISGQHATIRDLRTRINKILGKPDVEEIIIHRRTVEQHKFTHKKTKIQSKFQEDTSINLKRYQSSLGTPGSNLEVDIKKLEELFKLPLHKNFFELYFESLSEVAILNKLIHLPLMGKPIQLIAGSASVLLSNIPRLFALASSSGLGVMMGLSAEMGLSTAIQTVFKDWQWWADNSQEGYVEYGVWAIALLATSYIALPTVAAYIKGVDHLAAKGKIWAERLQGKVYFIDEAAAKIQSASDKIDQIYSDIIQIGRGISEAALISQSSLNKCAKDLEDAKQLCQEADVLLTQNIASSADYKTIKNNLENELFQLIGKVVAKHKDLLNERTRIKDKSITVDQDEDPYHSEQPYLKIKDARIGAEIKIDITVDKSLIKEEKQEEITVSQKGVRRRTPRGSPDARRSYLPKDSPVLAAKKQAINNSANEKMPEKESTSMCGIM